MYELKVKNNRDEILTLTNNPNYTVYRVEGITPPKATINSSVNTTSDGSAVNSVWVEYRNIVIYVALEGDVEANRINLYKYFPLKKSVTLYFKNGSRDVYICGNVEYIECDLFANRQVAQISLICTKPYFKSVNEVVTYFSDVVNSFSFPFAIPVEGIEISSISSNARKTIYNSGEVESGVIIEIYCLDKVVNPVIYNTLNNTHLRLNITTQAFDKIVINTNVGEKSISLIRNGVTTNIIGYLCCDSEWFVLDTGDNVFTYSADEGQINMQITFTSNILYAGV